MELSGKNVVITGGSQGIGQALAERFASGGAKILLVARSEAKLEALSKNIGAEYLVADLTNPNQVDGLLNASIDKLGHVDVLINNAAAETSGPFNKTSHDELRRVARLNFEAPLILTRDFVAHMLERNVGHIVQLSSVAGAIPFVGQAAYSGSKAAITNLTETIRLELADTPIGFTVVSPGPISTEMWSRVDSDKNAFMAPALKRFRQTLFLPTLSPQKLADATFTAVQANKRFVRLPHRYALFYLFNNAPRRIVEMTLAGVKLDPR